MAGEGHGMITHTYITSCKVRTILLVDVQQTILLYDPKGTHPP